jgi:hypothetical protein
MQTMLLPAEAGVPMLLIGDAPARKGEFENLRPFRVIPVFRG